MEESTSEDGNLTILAVIMLGHPKSTGKIALQSADPTILPTVDPKYYSNQDDVDIHVEAYRYMEKVETADAFIQAGAKFRRSAACEDLFTTTVPRSNEFYKCMVKHTTIQGCHPCGTAKIGSVTDKFAVVDPQLRVYGVKNLRVADASVMPHHITANPQGACYMIGEKVANMIKSDWEAN